MNGYEDDSGPDEFDELDKVVEFVKESLQGRNELNPKYDVSLEMINLMMEEVNLGDIKIYQQAGGSWIAEVVYRGIRFIHVNGKNIPEFWEEILTNP